MDLDRTEELAPGGIVSIIDCQVGSEVELRVCSDVFQCCLIVRRDLADEFLWRFRSQLLIEDRGSYRISKGVREYFRRM